jgi:hypothetical protein
MQTLHDMLKEQQTNDSGKPAKPSVDLGCRYNKIGISAVAAAAQFHNGRETKAKSSQAITADRSSARGWSGHR